MERKRNKYILIASLALNGILLPLVLVGGTFVYLAGIATCSFVAVDQITDSVEDIKELPDSLEGSVEGIVGDSLPLGLK